MRFSPTKLGLLIVLLLLSAGTASAAIGTEYQITNAPGDQRYAYIHENKIVWMDQRTGDYDIYVYGLGPDRIYGTADDGGERVVANGTSNEYYPDIYRDLITYVVSEIDIYEATSTHANTSIFLFNLSSNVTVDLIPGDPYYQCCPQLYNITISWYDYRSGNYDVYIYDIGPDGVYGTSDDGGEFQVTDESANQAPQFIWGRNLVWNDYRNGNWDVYLYDAGPDGRFNTADDRGEFQVTTNSANQKSWDVREHMIVWFDYRNWGNVADIYGYDMGPDGIFNTADDRGEFRITDENAHQRSPIVYSNIIVWEDNRRENTDVYIYDLGPDEIFNTTDDGGEIPLVTNPYNQKRIEMYNGKIVYDDDRDGDRDIYMFDLETGVKIGLLANFIDYNLSESFRAFLKNSGIRIDYVGASNYTKISYYKFIVILGGPDAPDGVGEIVNELLTEKEKEFIRAEGNRKMYVKTNVWKSSAQTVMIIAGNDRWGTQRAGNENRVGIKDVLTKGTIKVNAVQ